MSDGSTAFGKAWTTTGSSSGSRHAAGDRPGARSTSRRSPRSLPRDGCGRRVSPRSRRAPTRTPRSTRTNVRWRTSALRNWRAFERTRPRGPIGSRDRPRTVARHELGHQCQAGGNARTPPGDADRGFKGGTKDQADALVAERRMSREALRRTVGRPCAGRVPPRCRTPDRPRQPGVRRDVRPGGDRPAGARGADRPSAQGVRADGPRVPDGKAGGVPRHDRAWAAAAGRRAAAGSRDGRDVRRDDAPSTDRRIGARGGRPASVAESARRTRRRRVVASSTGPFDRPGGRRDPCHPSASSPGSNRSTSSGSITRASSRPACCSRCRRRHPGARRSRTRSALTRTTSSSGVTRPSCSTSRASRRREHQLLIQADIEGLRDILVLDLDTFRAAHPQGGSRARHGSSVRRPDGGLVGPGEDARGRVVVAAAPIPRAPGAGARVAPREGRPGATGYDDGVRTVRRPHRRLADRSRDGDRHRGGRKHRAVPDAGVGRLRAGPRRGRSVDRLLHRRTSGRPRTPSCTTWSSVRPISMSRSTDGPSSTSVSRPTCATFERCSPGCTCWRPSRPSGSSIASRRRDRAATWRAVRGGALGLSVGVVVFGVIGLVAFDQLFEVFHEVFFPAGSYLFDPANDRLVQLFPFDFWQETAIVVGGVIIAIVAGCRLARREAGKPSASRWLRANRTFRRSSSRARDRAR